jgi:hypothetical protein
MQCPSGCSDPSHFHEGEERGDWLFGKIDRVKAWCLNERAPRSGAQTLRAYADRSGVGRTREEAAWSDEGNEVLLRVPFTETVKLKSFQMVAMDERTAPRRVGEIFYYVHPRTADDERRFACLPIARTWILKT